MSKAPWIERCTIDDEVLRNIYAADQDIYPAPLTYERLQSWVNSCPDLSICFQAEKDGDKVPIGSVIVLPVVKKHWGDLLLGRLKEIDVDPITMFAGEEDTVEVGLHVFHIERLDAFKTHGRIRYFTEFALQATREIAEKKNWNVVGYSGKYF
jgi:hypothetical protein